MWWGEGEIILEVFLVVNDLDAMLIVLSVRLVADSSKVAVHNCGDV